MRFRSLSVLVLAGVAMALTPVAIAVTNPKDAQPVMAAAQDDTPPRVVEDYEHPGASRIYAERGILLKKGDGRIMFTACSPDGDFIEVRSRNRDPFCFQVTGGIGYLTMEVIDAYLVFSDSNHTTQANYTINGVSGSKTVPPNGAEGIGEGAGQNSATLLEIRATR